MNTSSVSTYQPAVAYQGGHVGTSEQEPRSGQTQPRQAPAADAQRSAEDNDNPTRERGGKVNILA